MAEDFSASGAVDAGVTSHAVDTGAPPASGPGAGAGSPGTPDIFDLGTVEKFRYKGKEYSRDEFDQGYMRMADYTRKTQEYAQNRKFWDNLSVDLENVKSNPALVDQFKRVYPAQFHAFLRYVEQAKNQDPASGAPAQAQQPQSQGLDPRVEARIAAIENTFNEREVQAADAQMDALFDKLRPKYPFADEEAILARAQNFVAQWKQDNPGQKPNISAKQWEEMWKVSNDRVKSVAEKQYMTQVKGQVDANRKGADVKPGGGIPGQAPRHAKTIKEATQMALQDIESGAFG